MPLMFLDVTHAVTQLQEPTHLHMPRRRNELAAFLHEVAPQHLVEMQIRSASHPCSGRRQSARGSFRLGLRVVVGPHHIGDHLIAHHHIPVTGRSLPAADGGESRVTKELRIHRFTGEVGIAIHLTMSSLSASTVPFKVACIASVLRVEVSDPKKVIHPLCTARRFQNRPICPRRQ